MFYCYLFLTLMTVVAHAMKSSKIEHSWQASFRVPTWIKQQCKQTLVLLLAGTLAFAAVEKTSLASVGTQTCLCCTEVKEAITVFTV